MDSELLLIIVLQTVQLLSMKNYFALFKFGYYHFAILELQNVRLFLLDADVSVVNIQFVSTVDYFPINHCFLELDILFIIEPDLRYLFGP